MADLEVPATVALSMDRGIPLGNSLGPSGRRRLHVLLDQDLSNPIPVVVVDQDPGTSQFYDAQGLTSPNVSVDLIDVVVPVSTTRYLSTITASCRQEGVLSITVDAVTILTLRTGPAQVTVEKLWKPLRPIVAGANIKVSFKARAGSPISDVEAYLSASDITA